MGVIKLLVVDDHPMIRLGIRACLEGSRCLRVVGEATDGTEALAQVRRLKPRVVITEVWVAGRASIDGVAAWQREVPSLAVLVFTHCATSETIRRWVRRGVAGYLLKQAAAADFVKAVERVGEGESYFSPEIAGRVLAGQGMTPKNASPALTRREEEVVAMVAEGYTNKQIAQAMRVSERTALSHRQNLMAKLRIHNVAGLTRYAVAEGIVSARPWPSAARQP